MSVRLTTSSPFGFVNDWGREAARAACAELGALGHQTVVEQMKRSGANDQGTTMQGVQVSTVSEIAPGVFRSEVHPAPATLTVAQVLEVGRRPGKGVSRTGQAKLRVWIRRKGKALLEKFKAAERARRADGPRQSGRKSLEDAALDEATFVLARAIKRRGIKAAYGFYRNATATVQAQMQDVWRRVIGRFGRVGAR